MRERSTSSLHNYSQRFLRSTELARDFSDPKALDGYCLTDFGRACLKRIAPGLNGNSGLRAWRLTGDFGSGKSSFALFLANAFSAPRQRLTPALFKAVAAEVPDLKHLRYIPVLVVGSREPIAVAVLRGLHGVMRELFSRGAKSSLHAAIEKALAQKPRVTDAEVLELIVQVNARIIQAGKGAGTLLILDEVGKFLEFAAFNPGKQDVYFLQELAERATRSKKEPLVVVCLLHQGLNSYAEQLAHASEREWEKIGGRFEEIVFRQPLDQTVLLISSALNVDIKAVPDEHKAAAAESMARAIEFGWFGTASSRETLKALQQRLFPIDPMVVPVLVRTFQRFGQNERSLFSFLCSFEPFGLRAFCTTPLNKLAQPFQLADFYDYVRANFGHKLGVASYRTHWNLIESTIELWQTDDPLELRVLKTVGVLNLLNAEDLRPTEDAITWAVGGNSRNEREKVVKLLSKLESSRVLHFRGEGRGYSLWPYTSVDLEGRIVAAREAIKNIAQVSQVITKQLDDRPIVVRAHYIQTGNLRYFDVVYCDPGSLLQKAAEHDSMADGVILVPLCETEDEREQALASARALPCRPETIQLVAVPRPLSNLSEPALNAERWQWIQENTPELNSDRFAREEVEQYRQDARNRLHSLIQNYIGINRVSGSSTLTWIRAGETLEFKSGRQVLKWLSGLCDEVFKRAPRIKNELVNRHFLSSAAKAARMRLIDLMFLNPDKPALGLPEDRKPPEKSMYLSVLKNAGVHKQRNGVWSITDPSPDSCHLTPVLDKIRTSITSKPDARIPIKDLIRDLRKPPYGLREGLFPILLAIVAIADEQEIAFYENGTFLRDVGRDAFVRMTRAPQTFDIQYCKIEGVRSQVFKKLAEALELRTEAGQPVELLDVVRKLCEFVAQLPEFSRNTKNIRTTTRAVREIILEARQPVHMVFRDLPVACDLQPFEVGKPAASSEASAFVSKLKESLDELRDSYHHLSRRIENALAREFGNTEQAAGTYRRRLAERAERLLLVITETKLKAFAFRLMDPTLTDPLWLESLGSFVALRPPAKWKDEDEETFERELSALAGRFKRAESAAFMKNGSAEHDTAGVRVAVTKSDGSERQEVIHFAAADAEQIKNLQNKIRGLIASDRRLGVIAASEAIWSELNLET
jgi:hypothetical protein